LVPSEIKLFPEPWSVAEDLIRVSSFDPITNVSRLQQENGKKGPLFKSDGIST
jgi:hypothetical protein